MSRGIVSCIIEVILGPRLDLALSYCCVKRMGQAARVIEYLLRIAWKHWR